MSAMHHFEGWPLAGLDPGAMPGEWLAGMNSRILQ